MVQAPRESLEAEILFLCRQLALYRERRVKPRRVDAAARARLAFLSRWCDWRSALVVARPETLIRWHRPSFRLLWLSSANIRYRLGNGGRVQLWHDHGVLRGLSMIVRLTWELILWCGLLFRSRESLEAEILFLLGRIRFFVFEADCINSQGW